MQNVAGFDEKYFSQNQVFNINMSNNNQFNKQKQGLNIIKRGKLIAKAKKNLLSDPEDVNFAKSPKVKPNNKAALDLDMKVQMQQNEIAIKIKIININS